MKTSVFILGGGGHAKPLLDCLLNDKQITVLGILDKNPHLQGQSIFGIPIVGDEDEILKHYDSSQIKLVNAIGSTHLTEMRKNLFQKFKAANFHFLSVIHATAYIARDVILEEGSQLLAGSIVQPSARIGKNTIINTRASVDHDCIIGDHVHLAPGVVCCGNVKIGEGTHIGSGAVIRQGIIIANDCIIAAGAVVVDNIISKSKVAGIPAKLMA